MSAYDAACFFCFSKALQQQLAELDILCSSLLSGNLDCRGFGDTRDEDVDSRPEGVRLIDFVEAVGVRAQMRSFQGKIAHPPVPCFVVVSFSEYNGSSLVLHLNTKPLEREPLLHRYPHICRQLASQLLRDACTQGSHTLL